LSVRNNKQPDMRVVGKKVTKNITVPSIMVSTQVTAKKKGKVMSHGS